MDANSLLIIEDSPIQSKIICQRFESLTPFTLLAAHSMAEAESLLEEHGDGIFAAVVDLNLPDAPDGETVDLCLSRNIPCIVLAASFDETLRKRFLEKKVVDYFLKGSIDDLEPLVAAVERLHKNYSVKALVVDDSGTQRGLVKRMLSVQCITSLEAVDGVAALEMLEKEPDIRLVITDFNMPRMDGIQLVQEIRKKRRISQLAVIGLSSVGSGPLTAQFLKNGANDFLTRPFEAEEFYWRVNQTLNILDIMQELRDLRKSH
ncbi:response regulator [Desulfovibrio sp. OttesenSCG-928-O18]|nr:response regulator [Desulfovibrio sp. OttesenSCG-928-O18]